MTLAALFLFSAALAQDEGHQANAIYQQLLRGELADAAGDLALPEPLMPDGLDAAAQAERLSAIPGRRLPVSELTRDATGAPFVLSVRDVAGAEQTAPLWVIDLWFVAHGPLEAVAFRRHTSTLAPPEEEVVVHLGKDDLARRGIAYDPEAAPDEGYTHVVSHLLERVELKATVRYQQSRSADSLVIASTLDARFADDERHPNQWRDMQLMPGGERKLGPPQPYSVSAMYTKVTRLEAPTGALLVEFHALVEHSADWFGGRDLLRSKLPIGVQGLVREFRIALKQAARDE
jgi:hypothetical protein